MSGRLQILVTCVFAALCLLSGYFLGRRATSSSEAKIETITDTLRITDTVLVEKPVPVEVRVVDTMLVAVTDTVHLNDTVYLTLPRETKVYGDATYTAQVSGYRPALDWIEVYPQREVVTRDIFVDSRKRWGIGLQVGYGAYAASGQVRLAPYLGIGISWNLIRF